MLPHKFFQRCYHVTENLMTPDFGAVFWEAHVSLRGRKRCHCNRSLGSLKWPSWFLSDSHVLEPLCWDRLGPSCGQMPKSYLFWRSPKFERHPNALQGGQILIESFRALIWVRLLSKFQTDGLSDSLEAPGMCCFVRIPFCGGLI